MSSSPEEEYAGYVDQRSDPTKSAARYDEVVHLRMFLWDIKEALESNPRNVQPIIDKINKLSGAWGSSTDCTA